ncbi:unnamed protein product [Rotaria sp. Silwood1]|nr:unnamed protein product [Rotaria sp. Silwood1]
MAKDTVAVHLQKLLNNKLLLSSSHDKKSVISAYDTLISILQTPEMHKQLPGHHDLLFECISQIILTSFNQYFHNDQLRFLLQLVSNTYVLSMSQNQIINSWLKNIEERTFEKPDSYDNDDDGLYEDVTESEDDEKITSVTKNTNNESKQSASNQHKKKHNYHDDSSHPDFSLVSPRDKSRSLTKPISNQCNASTVHIRDKRNDHQHSEQSTVHEASTRGNHNRKSSSNSSTNDLSDEPDNSTNKERRAAPSNNKYGADLRLYDCYICGEYGHIQYHCPMKKDKSKVKSRAHNRTDLTNKKKQIRSESSSSISSIEIILSKRDQGRIQRICNQSTKLIDCCYTNEKRNKTFKLLLARIRKLEKLHGKNLSTILYEKESIFYSLVCHVAQNNFLFTNDQYLALYDLKNILLPQKYNSLNQDRSIFCRQRTLIPLNIIIEHIKTQSKIQQLILDDFQEHIIRSTSPISTILFDLIKYVLKSNIYIDIKYLEYFSKTILFDMKKNIFSNEQFDELHIYYNILMKNFERDNPIQAWKERIVLFKNGNKIPNDLDQWISELDQIINKTLIKKRKSQKNVLQHAMWYFIILTMASSGHLNQDQYECVLKSGIQSTLFNSKQKFYFQYYLNQGHAPITINELNHIETKLRSQSIDDKKLAYEQMIIILDRSKPEFKNEQPTQSDDLIPIIDDHVLLYLISLIEMFSSDAITFTTEQFKELLDKFLHQSTIVRPIPYAEQQRLVSFYSRSISLNELKTHPLLTESDLNHYLLLLKSRPLMKNDKLYDYLTTTVINIFKNRQKFSNEKCQDLKNILVKNILGKNRYRSINEAYENFRLNKNNLLIINRTILNQLLNNILLRDCQAHLEFLNLLEDISQSINFKKITIEFEINLCFVTTIILLIIDADYSNSPDLILFQQRLINMIKKETNFFSLCLTKQQYKLITSRLTLILNIDVLINLLQTNLNENNFSNLIYFIQNELKQKDDFNKLISFLIYTFDNEFLSIEQTLQISNLIFQHSKLNNKTFKHLLQFLIELLQLKIHSSPKIFLKLIKNNQDNDQTINQIEIILKVQKGKYAIAEWKRSMMSLLEILFDRSDNFEQLKDIALQSSMFQQGIFKQQIESYAKKTPDNQSDENEEPSATPKNNNKINTSNIHRELFRHLESDDASMNALIIRQLRGYLVDEQLSSEILLPKFIQALQFVFRNFRKFPEVSLDEWTTLIAKNRGKIFSNDAQCDQLLMNIHLVSCNIPTDTFNLLNRLIQSKKAHERHDGLSKLLLLLKNTQINHEKSPIKNLPTISNQFYKTITRVVFDEKFNNHQVRQCVTAARNSWLLNSDHREKLNNI